jgi:mannobiose 2-epimerase
MAMARRHLRTTIAWLPRLFSSALLSRKPTAEAPQPEEFARQAQRCRRILKTSIIDFYLPGCLDQVNGGYLEWLSEGKFVPTGEKFLTMQSRQLWFFSVLARHGIEERAARSAAGIGFDFLESKMRDREHGGYFSKVSDAGHPTDRRKHVYLSSFALYALTAYHCAVGDAGALAGAKDLFRTLEDRAHDRQNGGYVEFFEQNWSPIVDPRLKSYIGAGTLKTYNTHLHALEALTDLYAVWPDHLVRERLMELLLITTSTVRHPRFACNVDEWHPDWRTSGQARASYGHDVQCVWLALHAARILALSPRLLASWAEALCGHCLRFGYDRKYGGFFYAGRPGRPADDTRKEWWVQAEALVTMLEMYRLTGSAIYYAAFSRTLDFIEAHQVAPEGGWWATRAPNGAPKGTQRSSMWQGAYHSGRTMIRCAEILDDLAGARCGHHQESYRALSFHRAGDSPAGR